MAGGGVGVGGCLEAGEGLELERVRVLPIRVRPPASYTLSSGWGREAALPPIVCVFWGGRWCPSLPPSARQSQLTLDE